jgi:hypothetical protein
MRPKPLLEILLLFALVLTSPGLSSDEAKPSPLVVELTETALKHEAGPEYALSAGLLKDAEVLQRVTEKLWPWRRQDEAPHRFALIDETLPPGCLVKARATWTQYAVCR